MADDGHKKPAHRKRAPKSQHPKCKRVELSAFTDPLILSIRRSTTIPETPKQTPTPRMKRCRNRVLEKEMTRSQNRVLRRQMKKSTNRVTKRWRNMPWSLRYQPRQAHRILKLRQSQKPYWRSMKHHQSPEPYQSRNLTNDSMGRFDATREPRPPKLDGQKRQEVRSGTDPRQNYRRGGYDIRRCRRPRNRAKSHQPRPRKGGRAH
jgi:hypothetical protein